MKLFLFFFCLGESNGGGSQTIPSDQKEGDPYSSGATPNPHSDAGSQQQQRTQVTFILRTNFYDWFCASQVFLIRHPRS